jgi:hypothetical protein
MSKVEEQICRAMEEGQFDNLPGKGKPLHLEDNPFEDPEWRLAHHVLRSSGFTLPWIEARRELEAAILEARTALRRSWAWRQAALAGGQPVQLVAPNGSGQLTPFAARSMRLTGTSSLIT